MNSYRSPYMAEQKQDDQLEHTYSSYVRIRDVSRPIVLEPSGSLYCYYRGKWSKCYVLGKGHKINKTNTYLNRRIKVIYFRKQVIQCQQSSFAGICRTSHQPDKVFLRQVREQGRNPDTFSIAKNISGPVGIPLKRGSSGARWQTYPWRGLLWEDSSLRLEECRFQRAGHRWRLPVTHVRRSWHKCSFAPKISERITVKCYIFIGRVHCVSS